MKTPRIIDFTPRMEAIAAEAEVQGISMGDYVLQGLFTEVLEHYLWEQDILRRSTDIKSGARETYSFAEVEAIIG